MPDSLAREVTEMLKVKDYGYTAIMLSQAACPEYGGKYALTCYSHGRFIQDNNKHSLWAWAKMPQHWCDLCREQFEKVVA